MDRTTGDRWLVLEFAPGDVTRLSVEAKYVHEQYQTRRASVYETSQERILRGLLAEDMLAQHRGVERANVRRPWATPYDVAPDIEVRCVMRPLRLEHWSGVALTLYRADKKKVSRRWVLAMIDFDRMDIRYLGWQTGSALLKGAADVASQEGRAYHVAGMLWPDELRPMSDLA